MASVDACHIIVEIKNKVCFKLFYRYYNCGYEGDCRVY